MAELFNLAGSQTTHRVNSVAVQPGRFGCVPTERAPRKIRFRRTLAGQPKLHLEEYYIGKRIGPKDSSFPVFGHADFMLSDQEQLYLSWIMCRQHLKDQYIPSWTGFNIKIHDRDIIMESSVHYLPWLDATATEYSTIMELMNRALKMKESLKLSGIVCVFDQSTFAKAAEIKWRDTFKYKSCVLLLGTFHTIMMYMNVICKRFKDAGLRDVLIQSGAIAEGSKDAITGKMYNRGVRCYKLMYEALYHLLIQQMETHYQNNVWNNQFIGEAKSKIEEAFPELSAENFSAFQDSQEFWTFCQLFLYFKQKLQKNGSDLEKFSLSFIEMVEHLVNVLYATRTGKWHLYLESLRNILPYTFAYDHLNYAKYMTAMLGEMLNLEQNHPNVCREFVAKNFCVKLSPHSFSSVEADKVIETTINRDTKTSVGLKGFSMTINTVNKWILHHDSHSRH